MADMTLTHWIQTLEGLPKLVPIEFDFGRPVGPLISWRGVYAELSLSHGDVGSTTTVGEALDDARKAVGGVFTGYKGGDFTMGPDSEVWADDYGSAGGTCPIGTRVEKDKVVVITAVDEDIWS